MTARGDETTHSRTRTALIAILVVLIILLIGLGAFVVRIITPAGRPTGAGAVPTGLEWVRSLYGFGAKGSDQLYRPTDAAIGPDGSIYAADAQRARIMVFNADGSFRNLIQTGPAAAGPGKLYRPMALSVAPNGDVYVCEFQNQRIMVFSSSGRLIREWDMPAPTGVAVVGQRVYATSSFGVAVFALDGKLLATWGRRGRGPEEFDNPRGIVAGRDGTIYLSDTLNGRVKAYRQDGTLLWVWPADRRDAKPTGLRPRAQGSGAQLPSGAAIDGQDRLVFVDPFAYQLVVLKVSSKEATLVAAYGAPGERDGYFMFPSGLAYDADRDWFAVADTNNDRVQIVRISGSARNAVLAAARRATTGVQPWCFAPLLLLLLAVVIAVVRRRGRRSGPPTADDPGETDADFDEGE